MFFCRNRQRIPLGAALALLPLVLASLPKVVQAQQLVEYAVKFVCGVPGIEAQREAVKPGNYATAINIHNPNPDPAAPPVVFAKKAVQAFPQGFDQHPPSDPKTEQLRSDFALEVDCQNISDLLGGPPPPAFMKGFLVIMSPAELDVVAVYTAEPPVSPADGVPHGIALEVVPVPPRFIRPGAPQPPATSKSAPTKK